MFRFRHLIHTRWHRSQKWIILALFLFFLASIILFDRFTIILEQNSAMKKTPIRQDLPKLYALSTYLMVLIMTKPEEINLRDTIRQTWLRLSTKTPEMYKHLFVMGTKALHSQSIEQLNGESDKYGDLLTLNNFTESYEKLTEKTLSAISISVNIFNFKFLLKVDGDSFVRLGALLKSLRDIEHPKLYWGFLDGRARPFAKGKWLEEEWRLCDYYLPYQLGGGYILSRSLAEFIANNRHLLKLYRSEDVSVGAWLAGLDVRYVHDPRFDTEWKSRGCNNEYLITHKKTQAEMHHLFENLAANRELCFPSEYQIRPSYVYDFSVAPSRCCVRRNGTKIP